MLKKLSMTVKKEKTTQYCRQSVSRSFATKCETMGHHGNGGAGARTVSHCVSSSVVVVKRALSE